MLDIAHTRVTLNCAHKSCHDKMERFENRISTCIIYCQQCFLPALRHDSVDYHDHRSLFGSRNALQTDRGELFTDTRQIVVMDK